MEHYKNRSLIDIPGEVWFDIIGYDGFYKLSSFQRIKSLKRTIIRAGRMAVIPEKILKQNFDGEYLRLSLYRNGIINLTAVHRIVAIQFIPNPLKKKDVNHINGIKIDNRVENLEWMTRSENIKHAYENGLSHSYKGADHVKSKWVIQCDLYGNEMAQFGSQHEASRMTGISQTSISSCCLGKLKSAGGFKWKGK